MITYLYHKRHKQTGLNYFGKTIRNPYTYIGSGKYWTAHLKKHGFDIETVQVWEFTNLAECSKFATEFSQKNYVVESNDWANLRIENGLDGGFTPAAYTQEAKNKKSLKLKGRVFSKETIAKMSSHSGKHLGEKNPMYGKSQSKRCKEKAQEVLSKKLICCHCQKEVNLGNFKRWHGDACKKIRLTE